VIIEIKKGRTEEMGFLEVGQVKKQLEEQLGEEFVIEGVEVLGKGKGIMRVWFEEVKGVAKLFELEKEVRLEGSPIKAYSSAIPEFCFCRECKVRGHPTDRCPWREGPSCASRLWTRCLWWRGRNWPPKRKTRGRCSWA
jgi:hypothetical protein